jgi:hypothetical protein
MTPTAFVADPSGKAFMVSLSNHEAVGSKGR